MPKLIDYPRTSYTGAWELAEIVDDTGGKCAIETAARKLNRKVSGSFKAIIGSAVKFGLITSKRELLTTTTLFRRIKHAYDKAEELQFHREAFLTPPLFTQVCRKFRNRELPVQMLDVMLIREFGVEEINAQNVAKAFVDGCRMCGLLDERNIIADIDALSSTQTPRRELASQTPTLQSFTAGTLATTDILDADDTTDTDPRTNNEPANSIAGLSLFGQANRSFVQQIAQERISTDINQDAVANLFGLNHDTDLHVEIPTPDTSTQENITAIPVSEPKPTPSLSIAPLAAASLRNPPLATAPTESYLMQMSGPGVNTSLDITDEDDLAIAIALLEKIRRRLRANK